MESAREFSSAQLIKGLFAGLGIGALCLALDFFLGLVLSGTHFMISLSLIFIFNVICGVSMIRP
jgi:hypothetical protein